jgi:hypothetical protein
MKPVAWLFGNRIVFTVYGTTAAEENARSLNKKLSKYQNNEK